VAFFVIWGKPTVSETEVETGQPVLSERVDATRVEVPKTACPVCNHPKRTDIDRMMVDWADAPQRHRPDRDEFLNTIWSRFRYYSDDTFTGQAILTHFTEHARLISIPPLEVDRANGIVRRGDEMIRIPEIPDALDTIIALGIDNLSQDPSLIKPHHLIQALKLKAQLQPHSLHQDEFISRIFEILQNHKPPTWAKDAPLYRELQRLTAPQSMKVTALADEDEDDE